MICPREGCGGGLARVETHGDWGMVRRRAVFACGHDQWEPLPASAKVVPPKKWHREAAG